MPELRAHLLGTPHSGIRRMLELAAAVPDPVMLVNGDPNFTTPAHIIDAAAAAAHRGGTGYAPGGGLPQLRSAIAAKVAARNGITASAEQVCITTGACGGLYTTLMLLAGPGDEVLLPDPGWSNYAAMTHVLGARAVGYPAGQAAGWSVQPSALEAMIGPRTRAILVNSPSNPTGAVESAEQLSGVLEVARRHDLWVISDEAYDEILLDSDDRHTSLASLGGADRVVSVFSFSKTYAMTGWRVGYVVGPAGFIRQLSLHQEPVVSCASTVSQHAALAALSGPQDCVGHMVSAYRRRRDAAIAQLSSSGCGYVRPRGGFFLMADIRGTGLGSWDFAAKLLEQELVAVVPGAAFGQGGEGFVRVSLAVSDDVLTEGIAGLAAMIRRCGR
jgi:aspartate aminotransferase